jgi:hypothetical protein
MGKINGGDLSGAVRLLSSEDAVAAPTAELLDALRAKHPSSDPDEIFPAPPNGTAAAPSHITATEVLEAI